jgi:hypothetical protein
MYRDILLCYISRILFYYIVLYCYIIMYESFMGDLRGGITRYQIVLFNSVYYIKHTIQSYTILYILFNSVH